ncbi:MAG: proS, partial [Frankiales bacterium]|nr:proS [Frankiales bacterium]
FDLDDDGLRASYAAHRATYVRIFDRLGMDYRVVSAVSGAMGGSASEEFLAVAPTGEDSFVSCTSCDYAANVEAVEVGAGTAGSAVHGPVEVLDTPDTPTIETLATFLGITAGETLKNVVVKLVQPDGTVEPLIVGLPGDREIDMKRLEANVAPAEVVAFEGEDFAKHPGLVRGYIGPQGELGVRYVVDPLVAEGSAWVTGANQEGKHARNVVMGRDFTPDGFLAAAEVRDGDPCPRCGSSLSLDRGIEIGHVFQLGRKYADAFALDVLGPEGKPVRVTMGSYGIGVSRAVAAIAEQSYDDRGLIWPRAIAPADVHVVIAGQGEQQEGGQRLAEQLEAAGVRVLLDDRHKVSPGVAFKDAELIGVPTYVVVGKTLAADGTVEIRDRKTGSSRAVAMADAVPELVRETRA